ncbi:MAG: lytic transglycosylase domain-containing protein [Clostridiales bacterium]|nr:lytic transglycosylase domain-containing protein [Clostridiales bacterium]
MAKRLIIVWLFTLSILLFSSVTIYAEYTEDNVQGDFFIKNIIINGEKITNYNLQYSIVLYDDTMYMPLTTEMCEIYGLDAKMDWLSHTLTLQQVETTRKNISDNRLKNDAGPMALTVIPEAKVVAHTLEDSYYIFDTLELIGPSVTVEDVDLNGKPLLRSGGLVYVPLRAITDTEIFGWNVYFDNYYGVCISTDDSVSAETFFSSEEAKENKGLVNYVMHYNSNITPSYGQRLVFLFKRAGEVYGVDPKLLMAIAHTESKFNPGAVSRAGAIGMMQVMPATAERAGFAAEQMKNPKTAIDFCAKYISDRLVDYNGNLTLALSAYNQGTTRVNRGAHSNVYANKVMSAYSGIENYLQLNGYN